MSSSSELLSVETPLGEARLHVALPAGPPVGTLALGHGAGGGVAARDLAAVSRAACQAGWRAVRIEQPYRVAGRRIAPPPPRLDIGWLAALAALGEALVEVPLVVGGRSAGARVGCRTASSLGAAGVCCLAFPLHPPGRPDRSRAGELALAGVPVLVVQGARDPFGSGADIAALGLPGVEIREVSGDHGLTADLPAVVAAVLGFLGSLVSV